MARAEILHIHPIDPQPRFIQRAVEVLEQGGVIAHPTDTTYALGVHLKNKQGIEKLYRLKGKDLNRPLSLLCADLSNIADYANVDNLAHRTMKRLLPGPYTFILPATKNAPRITQTPRKEVGLRCPDDNIVRAIIQKLGMPLVSTSCKPQGGELLASPEEIDQYFGPQIELIVDAGYIYPEPSTILSFMTDVAEVVRQGKGPIDQLR